MQEKTKSYIFYGIVLSIVLLIFLFSSSTNYLKKPLLGNDNVELQINKFEQAIDSKKWGLAKKELQDLKSAWYKVEARIQYTGELDDIKDIEREFTKLEADIQIKDYQQAKNDLASLKFSWADVGK